MIKFATVTSISPFKVKFFGESTTSNTSYWRLGSYTPGISDTVAFLVLWNIYLCLGKVVK